MSKEIRNLVLFVGDAVRYDASVSRLKELGPTYDTVAASLHTPASFGTLLTGLHVPSHGVTGFDHVLPDSVTSLVDIESHNTAFSHKTGTMHQDLYRIFDHYESSSLEDISEPFIWIVRDPGGHAPYDGYDPQTYDQVDENAQEYLHRVAGNPEQFRRDYQRGVKTSIDLFEEALDTLKQRGIADRTLAVYTSDHGELLGEYGLVGHNHVACPELVRVPTTFVHGSLEPGTRAGNLRHVDLFSTCLRELDVDETDIPVDGEAIVPGEPVDHGLGYSHFESKFYDSRFLSGFNRVVKSCWDTDGGRAYSECGYLDGLAIFVGLILFSAKGKQMRRTQTFLPGLKALLPGETTYGNPGFSPDVAREFIRQVSNRSGESREVTIDDETRERLDDMGYL